MFADVLVDLVDQAFMPNRYQVVQQHIRGQRLEDFGGGANFRKAAVLDAVGCLVGVRIRQINIQPGEFSAKLPDQHLPVLAVCQLSEHEVPDDQAPVVNRRRGLDQPGMAMGDGQLAGLAAPFECRGITLAAKFFSRLVAFQAGAQGAVVRRPGDNLAAGVVENDDAQACQCMKGTQQVSDLFEIQLKQHGHTCPVILDAVS